MRKGYSLEKFWIFAHAELGEPKLVVRHGWHACVRGAAYRLPTAKLPWLSMLNGTAVAVVAASESTVKNADFFILIVLVFDWIRDIIAEAIGMLI